MNNVVTLQARRLRHHLIQAKQQHSHMAVLTDAAGHKMAQKLYHQYVSDSDYSKMPAFVQALDSLLSHFGAGQNQGEEDESMEPGKNNKPDDADKNDKRDTF